jgi:hypothetical protein
MRRDPLGPTATPAKSEALPPPARPAPPLDDYQVYRDSERVGPPVSVQLLRIARGVLLIVLAAISLALCWVVALLLHLV